MNTKRNNLIKIRIQIKSNFYIGPGKVLLLEKISEKGSISQAAKSIGLSYKKAWKLIDELNKNRRKCYDMGQVGNIIAQEKFNLWENTKLLFKYLKNE